MTDRDGSDTASNTPFAHPLDEFLGSPKPTPPASGAPTDPRAVTAGLLATSIALGGLGFIVIVWGAISVILSPFSAAEWVVYLGTVLVLAAAITGAVGAWRALRI